MPTPTEWAYAAGIVDGEGSVSVARKVQKSGRTSYGVIVMVAMTAEEVPLWMQSRFGGGLRVHDRSKRHPTWKPMYRWYLSGKPASDFLSGIIPYLVIKQARARLAAELGSYSLGRRNGKGLKGYMSAPPAESARREELAMQIRAENFRTNPAVRKTAVWGRN